MWDVRKDSQSSGVLQFGSSGPYHHSLLGIIDLNGPLAAAQNEHLSSPGSDFFVSARLETVCSDFCTRWDQMSTIVCQHMQHCPVHTESECWFQKSALQLQ
jgi:hypothetical protein